MLITMESSTGNTITGFLHSQLENVLGRGIFSASIIAHQYASLLDTLRPTYLAEPRVAWQRMHAITADSFLGGDDVRVMAQNDVHVIA